MNNMDTFSYSITIKSSKELSEAQEKDQERYFSLKKRSKGGECKVTKLSPSLYRVSYKNKEVKERVLKQKDHCMESQGDLIQFTLQEEEANKQKNEQSQELPGNATSLSCTPSENKVLKEMKSFIPLESDLQYVLVKDEIDAFCQSFQSLKVCCENKELILSSEFNILKIAREKIKNILSLVKVRKPEVSTAKADFLTSWKSKDISEKLFGDLPEGMVILDISRGFFLYALSENLLDQAEAILKKDLLRGSIRIKADDKDTVSSEPGKQLLDKLMGNTEIKISFQDDDNTNDLILTIVGFTEEVKKALKEYEDLLHQRKFIKEEVFLKYDILIENLDDLLKWYNLGPLPVDVQILKAMGQTVYLKGPRKEVEKFKFVLQKLMQKHVDNFCIKKYGATSFFKNQGKALIDVVQKEFGCRVFICDTENKKNKAESIRKVKTESGSLNDKEDNKKEVKNASFHRGTHEDGDRGSNQIKDSPMERPAAVVQFIVCSGTLENKNAKALIAPLLSTSPNLQTLNVTKGLKNKGGERFANLFTAVFGHHTSLKSGQHYPMSVIGESYSLNCDYVIFIACHSWDGKDGSSVKALKKGISDALNYCQDKKLHSVAMSVIGPGIRLGYPSEEAVCIIGEEVKSFVEREPNTCVKKIELVIPTENKSLYYVCREKLLEMNLGDGIHLCNEDGVAFPKISHGEESEVKIGNLSLAVTYNDIRKECTDVIVNSTNFSHWNEKTVAHAIFSAVEQSIITAAQCGASKDKVVMTEAGSTDLKCKYIMHCNCKQDVGNISALVKEIILKCESVGLHSVAFPAIGTGECRFDAEIVAHHMVDAISTLAKTRNMTSLTSVRLVTFSPSTYYIFCAELKKVYISVKELSWEPLELLTSRLKHQQLPENDAIKDLSSLQHPLLSPTTQLVIVTDKKDIMNEIKCALEKGFENAVKYRVEIIEEPLLSTFSLQEIEMVFSVLNDQNEVGMTLDRLNNYISIEGCEKDVVDVTMKVHTNLRTVTTSRLQILTKERTGLLIQWGYSNNRDSKPFTVEASQLLEDKYQSGKSGDVIVTLENQMEAAVNLERMQAVIQPTKEKVNVIRRDLETEHQCPAHWDNMNGRLLMCVQLDPNSEEFERVKSNFNRTVNCPIKKVVRIQNTYQHTAYMLRKCYITEKNGPCNVNEKLLFHGTAPQNCHPINYSGFDRRFSGQNAVAYGNGVYFAENASYSANPIYSPPDPNTGERFIYQVKVLVGRHTKGQRGMNSPPCRTPNDPFDYYDSLTDQTTNPTMFIVFHDDQAYPEYLITFT